MTLAADPLAPQKDLTSNELASGYGYAPGVSYVSGICNPAGRRSGTTTTVATAAEMRTALASCSYGDDIVIAAGGTLTTDSNLLQFPTLGAITATTPRQPPARMTTYVSTNAVSSTGTLMGGVIPTSPEKMASVTKTAAPVRMASVIIQGDPSYVRIMSSEAHLVTTPPPHTSWHITNYSHFAHMVQGNQSTAILGTPDFHTHYDQHHFRMEGIRFVNLPGFAAGNGVGAYVYLGSINAQISPNGSQQAPHHFIWDRCYLDGAAQGTGDVIGGYGSNRGIGGYADYFALMNSRCTGNFGSGGGSYQLESNAIAFSGGIGPTHIENNWLEGAGENVLMNANPVVGYPPPYIQSDCTFTRNWCIRPLTWRESFHYNAVPPNQRGEATVSIDAGGTTCTLAFSGATDINGDVWIPGDLFWTSTSGRPVAVSTLSTDARTFTLASPYTENAGGAGLRFACARARTLIEGGDGKKVTLSGAGNRTVTGTGTTWLTTLKPWVDAPPPGSGVYFGVNTNLTSTYQLAGSNNQKFNPVLKRILSVDSDTQLTLAEDYTAGSWTNVYYSVTLWDGMYRSVMKNLHEWKASNRIRIVGNVFENAWETFNGQGPNAWALNIAATGTFSYHRDQYYGYNVIIAAGLLHYYTGYPYNTDGPPQDPTLLPNRRICIEHNLCVDVANRKWITDYGLSPNINSVYQLFHPVASHSILSSRSGSVQDYQLRHNTIILSTDYDTSAQLIAFQFDDATDPNQTFQRFTVRDNIAHVGSHAVTRGGQTAGFFGAGDAYDVDAALAGTAPGNSAAPVSSDSICAYNVVMRNSAPAIGTHSNNFGGGFAGVADETSVGFQGYGSHVPYYLTQSATPTDYTLSALYTTSPGVCTVSGATVTISVGSFPSTIVAGVPFYVSGDGVDKSIRVLTRDSGSQLTLASSYLGTTGSGLTGILTFQGAASDATDGTVFTTAAGDATVSNISSVSYSESFTHANEATLSGIDQPWTQTVGSALGIASNAAQVQAVAFQIAVCQTNLRTASHFAQVTLSAFSGSSAQGGVCVNAASDGTSMYVFTSHAGLGSMELWKWVNGTKTTLATSGTAAGAGDVLKLDYNLSTHTLTGSVNGVTKISFTDPSPITSNTYAGIAAGRGGGGDAVSLDTFSAQTNITLDISLVTLASGTWSTYVAPFGHGLFPRYFLVSGDPAGDKTAIATRDSASVIALASAYPGTTGAGLTGVVSGPVQNGTDPGANTTVQNLLVSSIRT